MCCEVCLRRTRFQEVSRRTEGLTLLATAFASLFLRMTKKILRFLAYLPVILVAILGAYIVFHMWRLAEIGRRSTSGDNPGNHHVERVVPDSMPSASVVHSKDVKTTQSPGGRLRSLPCIWCFGDSWRSDRQQTRYGGLRRLFAINLLNYFKRPDTFGQAGGRGSSSCSVFTQHRYFGCP
jgi:hypothetical protein